jgi:inorganic pyrophosphatase
MRYIDIPAGDRAPELFNVAVEIPKGSANKYEYDPELNIFRLDRALYSPVYYPADYGFVPSTRAADGDPLDAMVLVDNATFPGCLIEARPLGMLLMVDQGVEDIKVLCVSARDPRTETLLDYTDLEPHRLLEIEHFFNIYKELEGKKTETRGWVNAAQTKLKISDCLARFKASDASGGK